MPTPLVGIVMGSDSDWPVMAETVKLLAGFGVAHEVEVMSAHRTPERASEWASTAEARGLRVIIAAAGGAAHLAGVVAAHTNLPVIGVPLIGWALEGLDALLSTVQMPGGVPVATVAIGKAGARNAAVLATQILALNDDTLRQKLVDTRTAMCAQVREKSDRVRAEAKKLAE